MKACAGVIDQELSTDMTNAEKQYGCSEQRSNDRTQKGKECAVVLRPDHVVHGKSLGSHRKCTARLGHGGVATSLSMHATENNTRLIVMMLEVLAFPLDTTMWWTVWRRWNGRPKSMRTSKFRNSWFGNIPGHAQLGD